MPGDSPLRSWIRRHPILAFVVLAYGFTWLFWLPVGKLGGGDPGRILALLLIGGWGPALAALVVVRAGSPGGARPGGRRGRLLLALAAAGTGALVLAWRFVGGGKDVLTDGPGAGTVPFSGLPLLSLIATTVLFAFVISRLESPNPAVRSLARGLLRWRVAPRHYAFALLALPAVYLVGAALAAALGHSFPAPPAAGHPWQVWAPALASSFLLTALFSGGLCEELGWRGFLLPELQKRFSPLTASLILAPIWVFWHLPIYLNGIRPAESLPRFLLQGFVLSILFTWLYNRTGGSLLLVVLLHATVNNQMVLVPRTWYALGPALLLVLALVLVGRMYRRPSTAV